MVRSPNFVSLVHLPSMLAANAVNEAAHKMSVVVANFFIWTNFSWR